MAVKYHHPVVLEKVGDIAISLSMPAGRLLLTIDLLSFLLLNGRLVNTSGSPQFFISIIV